MNAQSDRALIAAVRDALAQAADPERAAGQQRYMKSQLPFRGLTAPQLKRTLRPLLAEWEPHRETWEATVRQLWDQASYREEWYAALALARHPSARPWLTPDTLPLWRHLIVRAAWWDVVDEVAAHLVGSVLMAEPTTVTPVMLEWAADEDLWIRRTAVLCQLRRRAGTDRALLSHAIEANLDERSFWLRKAIGWSLREFARADPDWVRTQVAAWDQQLSGLSRREALKHL